MARSKGTERKIEEEKLEYKARKVLAAEKKALKEKGHVIPDYTTFEYEKRLRKVATRGGMCIDDIAGKAGWLTWYLSISGQAIQRSTYPTKDNRTRCIGSTRISQGIISFGKGKEW